MPLGFDDLPPEIQTRITENLKSFSQLKLLRCLSKQLSFVTNKAEQRALRLRGQFEEQISRKMKMETACPHCKFKKVVEKEGDWQETYQCPFPLCKKQLRASKSPPPRILNMIHPRHFSVEAGAISMEVPWLHNSDVEAVIAIKEYNSHGKLLQFSMANRFIQPQTINTTGYIRRSGCNVENMFSFGVMLQIKCLNPKEHNGKDPYLCYKSGCHFCTACDYTTPIHPFTREELAAFRGERPGFFGC